MMAHTGLESFFFQHDGIIVKYLNEGIPCTVISKVHIHTFMYFYVLYILL